MVFSQTSQSIFGRPLSINNQQTSSTTNTPQPTPTHMQHNINPHHHYSPNKRRAFLLKQEEQGSSVADKVFASTKVDRQ
jgi:hypothetical protein